MAAYNGVTFTPHTEDGMFWPDWEESYLFERRHFPGADYDDIQFGGRGQYTLTVRCDITSDADLATLRSSMDGTARTLSAWRDGATFTSCLLVGMSNMRRWIGGQTWTLTLTFVKTHSP